MKKNTARILSFLLSVLTVAVYFTGCYYDNGKTENKEEDLPTYKQEVEEEEIEVDNSINVYIAQRESGITDCRLAQGETRGGQQ